MTTQTIHWEGTLTALSPVAHGQGTIGNEQTFNRQKIVMPDMSVVEVPFVSGNSLRHMIRVCGVEYMLRELGVTTLPGKHVADLLYAGGRQSKRGQTVNLEEFRRLAELVPILGLMGGALGNHIEPGKLQVGQALPICLETVTAGLVPSQFVSEAHVPEMADLLDSAQYTRQDPSRSRRIRALLPAAQQKLLEDGQAKRKAEREAGGHPAKGDSLQMIFQVETLAAGTVFYWYLYGQDLTTLEYECLAAALVEFARAPFVGGKRGIGLGRVRLRFERILSVDPHKHGGTELAAQLGQEYVEHLRSRRDEIMGALAAVYGEVWDAR